MADVSFGPFGLAYNMMSDTIDIVENDRARQYEHWANSDAIRTSSDRNAANNLMLNRPENQVARMKQAGLNPNFLGSIGSVGSTSSTGGTTGIAAPRTTKVDPVALAQIENLKADTDLKQADANKKKSETKGQDIQNDMSQIYLANLSESERLRLNNLKQDLANKAANEQLSYAQINEAGAQAFKAVADANESYAKAALAREETRYVGFYAKMKAADVQTGLLEAQLKGYGIVLEAQQIKINAATLKSEDNLRKAQEALSNAKEFFYNQRGKAVDHEIVQGYLNCINGALNAFAKMK